MVFRIGRGVRALTLGVLLVGSVGEPAQAQPLLPPSAWPAAALRSDPDWPPVGGTADQAVSADLAISKSASAANGRLVFALNKNNNTDVVSIRGDGAAFANLTNNLAEDTCPAWSPDGGRIAFSTNRENSNYEIFIIQANGVGPNNLSSSTADDTCPAWSPDGSALAYTTNRDGNDEIYRMNADGSGQSRLTVTSADDRDPVWSPDGSKIAFTRGSTPSREIVVMSSNGGGNVVNLTNNAADDSAPSWSPDGTKIAFQSNRDGNTEIWIMNADGSSPVRVTNGVNPGGPIESRQPVFSPDGAMIAFVSSAPGEPCCATDVYTINADGTGKTRVTQTGGTVSSPDWQPVFVAGAALTYQLRVVNQGSSTAVNVVVSDTLPANVTFTSISAPAGWNCTTPALGTTGLITCRNAALASSGAATIQIGGKLATSAPGGSTVSNTATVASDTLDPDPSDNSSTLARPVALVADLNFTMSASPNPVRTGNTLTYRMAVTNAGPSPASGVSITATFPASVTFGSATPNQGTCTGPACLIGNLGPGASASVTMLVTPTVIGTLVVTGTATANELDPVPANSVMFVGSNVLPPPSDDPLNPLENRVALMPIVLKERPVLPSGATVRLEPSTIYGSGIVVVNQNTEAAAKVVVQAYLDDGTQPTGWPVLGVSDSIDAGKSRSYFSGTPDDHLFRNLPPGTRVSLVVISDQPIASSVNTQRVRGGSAGEALGTSGNPFRVGTSYGIGESSASDVVFIPQITAKNFGAPSTGFSSKVYVQNAGGDDLNATFILYNRASDEVDRFSRIIRAFSATEFDPNSRPALGADMYSLKIVSDHPSRKMVAVVNTTNTGIDAASSQLISSNGSSQGAALLYAPRIVRRYYEYNSGIRVQNVGTTTTDIRFSYTFDGKTYEHVRENVQPGQSVGPYLGDDTTHDKPANLPNGVTGAAIIRSSNGQPLVGVVNEDNRTLGNGATYNLFRDADSSPTAVVPQVVNKLGNTDLDALAAVFISGVQFQNVGTAPASCTVRYATVGTSDVLVTASEIAPGASVSHFVPNVADSTGVKVRDGFNGSATIRCDQPVLAIGNLSVRQKTNQDSAAGAGDTFSMSNGLNR